MHKLAVITAFNRPEKEQRAAHWGDARHREGQMEKKGLWPTTIVAIFPIVTFAAVELPTMPAN
jgi:hypothetical protein